MPRAVWSGSITFGLVNVAVKAFTAVHDHRVRFHQLERGTGARVRHQKVSSKTGKPLEADEIERGFELHKGEYVVVDPDELDELRPASTRTIEISDFVGLEDVDPVFYNATYWLAPDGDAAARSYRLLFAALEDRDRAGIGTVVMRNVQYLAAIRPLQGALAMSTMRFADEVVDRKDLDIPSAKGKVAPKELALANQIIDALQAPWKPDRYHDTYTDELHDLIRRKAKGETIEAPEPAADTAKVTDLMEALRASVERAGTRRKARPKARAKGASTRPKAKKAATSSTRKRRAPASSRRRSTGGGKTSS